MNEKQLFKKIYSLSKKLGVEVYAVGGYVRDELLGDKKTKDIDFVVLGSGLEFANAFDKEVSRRWAGSRLTAGKGSLVEFPDFDTARYVFSDIEVEFAGARSEKYDEKSRKPAVSPATLEQDFGRRDFTINTMARKVESWGLGKIIDLYNGRKDLKDKILRTPLDPKETFFDDPLRMVRAARFAAQLGFSIEDKVLKAMSSSAKRLEIVSAERITEEFFKLLATPKPSIGLRILYGTHLLDEFLPEVVELSGVEEVNGYKHKDNLSHTFDVIDNIAELSDDILLRYAGLMHDIAKTRVKKFSRGRGWTFDMHEHLGRKMTRQIGQRMRMSKNQIEYVAKLVRWHLQPIALMDEGITDSAVRRLIVNLGDDLLDLLILCRSDITTGNQNKKKHRLENYNHLEKLIVEVEERDKLRSFQSPIRGEEIMEICDLKPGPTIGRIKKEIERAILDGEIPNEYGAAKEYFVKIKDKFLKETESWEEK